MTLNLYLDDCVLDPRLVELLLQAGHHVIRSSDHNVGLEGEDDDVHFEYAVEHGLVILTKNPADFELLHQANSLHFGILAVYQDNDPSRDMTNAEIVKAISSLCQAAQSGGNPIHGNFHSLNAWRF